MSRKLELKLAKRANQLHLAGKRKAAYIWGTLRKLGWRPRGRKS